jgi:hypothetical protein
MIADNPTSTPELMSISDFATKVKEKYPQYQSVDNQKLVFGILTKYPQYRTQVDLRSEDAMKPLTPSSQVPTIAGQPAGTMPWYGKAGLKLANDVTQIPSSLAGIPKLAKTLVTMPRPEFPGVKESLAQTAEIMNLDPKAIGEAFSNKDWGQLFAEIGVPTLETLALMRKVGVPKSLAQRSPMRAAQRIAFSAGGEAGSTERAARSLNEMVKTGQDSKAIMDHLNGSLSRLEGVFQRQLKVLGNTPISGESIAKAIEAKITPDMMKVDNGALAKALKSEANAYRQKVRFPSTQNPGQLKTVYVPRDFTGEELNTIRTRLNSDLDTFYSKDAQAQAIDKHKSAAGKIAAIAADDATRDLLYDRMGKVPGGLSKGAVEHLKKVQGDMISLKRDTRANLEKLKAEADYSYGQGAIQRLRGAVHGYGTTKGGPGVHVGLTSLLDALSPRSAGTLKRATETGKVFQPRRTPFDAVKASALAAMLAGRTPNE